MKPAAGQRYHVVVEAIPRLLNGSVDQTTKQFWIRTIPATACSSFELGGIPDERQGIVYYGEETQDYPTTPRGLYSIACRDENPANLVPVVNWTVPPPKVFGEPNFLFSVLRCHTHIDPGTCRPYAQRKPL